jgi:hypothetical protein
MQQDEPMKQCAALAAAGCRLWAPVMNYKRRMTPMAKKEIQGLLV